MYQYLAKYFSLHKRMVLPGIGILTAETKPSHLEFIEKTLHGPIASIAFRQDENIDDKHFIAFLSKEINATEKDATRRFEHFMYHLNAALQSGQTYNLPGIGILWGNEHGVRFTCTDVLQQLLPGVTAEKVIRQHAQHTIRVGEDHKTSNEMEALLQRTVEQDRWWIGAVVLGVLGVGAILYYYLSH